MVSDAFSMDGDGVDEDEQEWAEAGDKLPGRSSRSNQPWLAAVQEEPGEGTRG